MSRPRCLGIQQPLHCLGAERVHANPVDGVGRKHDALAILDGLARGLTRFHVARRIVAGAVESPISEVDIGLRRLLRSGSPGTPVVVTGQSCQS